MRTRERGATLIVGLLLLSLVTLLGLAGANGAHVETLLVQNEEFRENAANAAAAGLEQAVLDIVNASDPTTVPSTLSGEVQGAMARYEAVVRFAGFELAIPQESGSRLAAAHFEIVSTGFSARGAVDRQRLRVLKVVDGPAATMPVPCAPSGAHCFRAGELIRRAWQRVPLE